MESSVLRLIIILSMYLFLFIKKSGTFRDKQNVYNASFLLMLELILIIYFPPFPSNHICSFLLCFCILSHILLIPSVLLHVFCSIRRRTLGKLDARGDSYITITFVLIQFNVIQCLQLQQFKKESCRGTSGNTVTQGIVRDVFLLGHVRIVIVITVGCN